jgi:hypothetical protein
MDSEAAMSEKFTVISLGWGIQSWGLCAMSALGMLPKVDVAIHADTTHERAETYDFARRWTPWLEERGVRVVTVKAEDGSQERLWDDTGQTMIPLYTVKLPYLAEGYYDYDENDEPVWITFDEPKSMPGGEEGQLRRSCTQRWKIAPIRRFLRQVMATWKKPVNHSMAMRLGFELKALRCDLQNVEMWMGITLDEVVRMRESDVQYIRNAYPLIEMLDRPWTRGMVVNWLQENDLEVPVKSSCVFCPYHDRAAWREIKLSANGDWQEALVVDDAIRHKRPGYLCYLTADRKPLAECDFRNLEDLGQMRLDEVCGGDCWL